MSDALPEEPSADLRDWLIREQAERIGEQERRLAAQAEQIAVLDALVAAPRGQLEAAERAGSRHSGNSSMPPGTDDLPGRKPPRRQEGSCSCGRDLADAEDLGITRSLWTFCTTPHAFTQAIIDVGHF